MSNHTAVTRPAWQPREPRGRHGIADRQVCSVCGAGAFYFANRSYFCESHKQEAREAMRRMALPVRRWEE